MRRFVFGLALAVGLAAGARAQDLSDVSRYVFVPNRASADVAVIDTRTDTVVARLPVGSVPHQVAVSDTLGVLVASNMADDTVSVVDLRTGALRATLHVDRSPEHMELSPAGDLVAVSNIEGGSVSLIALDGPREIARIDGLYEPHNMTFSPDGRYLYVANLGADVVSMVDVAKAKVVREIPVGEPKLVAHRGGADDYQGIVAVTPTPDRRLGFAAFGEGDVMAVLDLRTGRRLRTLRLGDLPWRGYSTADGRYVIVPNNGDGTVSVVSTADLREVARLRGGEDMTGVNTAWFETTAFVISRGESRLYVLDLEKMKNAGTIELPGVPETGVTTPDGMRVYVALSSTDQVAVIDARTRRLVKLIDGVGEEPWGTFMVGSLNYCH